MDFDWKKKYIYKEQVEFYRWLYSWYNIHHERPREIYVNIIKGGEHQQNKAHHNNKFVEENNTVIIRIKDYKKYSDKGILLINERLSKTDADQLNKALEIIKKEYNTFIIENSFRLLITLFIIYYDWENRQTVNNNCLEHFEKNNKNYEPCFKVEDLFDKKLFFLVNLPYKTINNDEMLNFGFMLLLETLHDPDSDIRLQMNEEIKFGVLPPQWFTYLKVPNIQKKITFNEFIEMQTPSSSFEESITIEDEKESLTPNEKRELGRLRNEKIKWDSSIKAATIAGIFCGTQSQLITKKKLRKELESHKLYLNLSDTTFEKIWKAIPEKHKNLGGRPRKSE